MKLLPGAVAAAIAVALPCVTIPATADPTATTTRVIQVTHQATTSRGPVVTVSHVPRETLGDMQLARVLEISTTSVQPRPTLIPAVALPKPIAWAKVAPASRTAWPVAAHATAK